MRAYAGTHLAMDAVAKERFMLYVVLAAFLREILEGILKLISCHKNMQGTAATAPFTHPKKMSFID